MWLLAGCFGGPLVRFCWTLRSILFPRTAARSNLKIGRSRSEKLSTLITESEVQRFGLALGAQITSGAALGILPGLLARSGR